jgi:hypothetical protein
MTAKSYRMSRVLQHRRTIFAEPMFSALLDAGVDLSIVQTLAVHAGPTTTTTARYVRRPEDVQRRAAELSVASNLDQPLL